MRISPLIIVVIVALAGASEPISAQQRPPNPDLALAQAKLAAIRGALAIFEDPSMESDMREQLDNIRKQVISRGDRAQRAVDRALENPSGAASAYNSVVHLYTFHAAVASWLDGVRYAMKGSPESNVMISIEDWQNDLFKATNRYADDASLTVEAMELALRECRSKHGK